MWLLYNLLLTLLSPIWVPWMLFRTWKRKEKPNWKERQGDFSLTPGPPRIWVHTVSVGEFVASKPILREIRKALPKHEILVSVTTSSGFRTAAESEPELYDHLVYFPLDMARFQLAAMQRVQPDVVAIMETELWMNFLWAAKVFDAKTVLINGRISDRSFPRAKLIRFFYKALLKDVDQCLMQSEIDAERILALGAKEAKALGNCKFDQAAEALVADPEEWRRKLNLDEKPVIVIGSTRDEAEEKLVIEAIRLVSLDRVNVIHAPRHLERVEALAGLVRTTFGSVALRSKNESGPYLILDTYGELAQVYSVADVVVIGGGFSNLGGQNIIQPLALGKPVIHGPHMQNFRDVAASATRAGASEIAASAEDLAAQITELLQNDQKRTELSDAARQLVQANLGASRRYAEAIAALAEEAAATKAKRRK
ncbi:MAG: 3-deoxy-D-manno-octulosonic acid transferase [Fimbriimonas sp.]